MKKKVLFVAESLYGGGAEKILQTLLRHLDPERFEITLCSLKKEDLTDSYPSHLKYQFIFNSSSPKDSLFKRLKTRIGNKLKLIIYYHFPPQVFYRFFLGKTNYDTEVAFIEGYATRIVSGSTNLKSKKIAWIHIDLKNEHWTKIAYRQGKEEDSAYSRFDTVACVSKQVEASARELFPSMQHSCVVYNPIDSEAIFRQSQEPIDTDFPLLEGNPTLISVGRLVHQKGYERLLLIIKQLTDLGYNLTLNIIGEGTERPILEKKIKDLSLENQVRLLGFHKNPYPYIKASDIFVCSSYAEGFSTVITEALILGKAIVATNCSGIKEQLGECHEYGIVSENNNQSLFSKLKELISDPKLIEEYCRRAKKRGESFTLKTLLQPIEEDIL